jgi:multiple sugar transport system permease protein
MRSTQPHTFPRAVGGVIALALVLVWSLSPILWILSTSFKTKVDAFAIPPKIISFAPTLENYTALFAQYEFLRYITNSLVFGIGSTVIALALGTMAAYSLSRLQFSRKDDVQFWILSLRMMPPVAVLVPFFVLWTSLKVIDSYLPLLFMYTLASLPLCIWIMKSFFDDLPAAIEEAAVLDGCGEFRAFWDIALPLARPGLLAAGVLSLLQAWNEFLFALVLTGSATRTAAVSISQFITPVGTKWGEITAASTLVMLPPLVFMLLMQRHLVRGLVTGAVK